MSIELRAHTRQVDDTSGGICSRRYRSLRDIGDSCTVMLYLAIRGIGARAVRQCPKHALGRHNTWKGTTLTIEHPAHEQQW